MLCRLDGVADSMLDDDQRDAVNDNEQCREDNDDGE
jgi:hypothetical protein